MKLNYLNILVFLLLPFFSYSQTIEQVKKSGKYIYGIGESVIYEKADQAALNDLISQISVSVESKFEYYQTDSNYIYKEYAKSAIKTYSSATLNTALRIEEEKNGIYYVVRYIPKEDFYKIFEKRKKVIIEYTMAGIRSEWKLQIADALRNFYWANILLRSHPEYSSIKFCNEGDTLLLKVFLPNKINEIFSNISIDILEQNYNPIEKYAKYTLGLEYKSQPIQSLDYSYKCKNSWSGTISANNGIAYIEHFGDYAKKDKDVSIRIEYIYREKAFFDKDVQSVLTSDIELLYFSTCEKKLQVKKPKEIKNKGEVNVISLNEIDNITIKKIHDDFNELINDIVHKNTRINKELFTEEGLGAYIKLIKYGDAVTLMHDNDLKIVKVNDEILVRSVPMHFTFSKNRGFTENVVFIIGEDGKIKDINFSLSQVAINDIISKEDRFASNEEKYFIIRFLENYKTSYCLKRIDYLRQVFDEEALIIVGRVLKKYRSTDNPYHTNLSGEEVEYQRLTKGEYISRLKRIFSYNEFVNVHFEDCIVKKAKKDISIYGIQIAQHYTSETYADKGYLFLLLDLRDTLNPIIHVRTWQPKKNYDGSIYGLEDFPFEKL